MTVGGIKKFSWLFNRWMALNAAFWLVSTGGISFDFSLYSSKLKSILQLSQEQLNNIGTASLTGAYFGIFAAPLSVLFQPWVLFLCGAVLNFAGFLVLWLVTSQKVTGVPLIVVILATFIASSAQPLFQTGGLLVSVNNFPNSRGMVVGLLKGVAGIGGAVCTLFYSSFLFPVQSNFLLMVTIYPTVLAFLGAALVHVYHPSNNFHFQISITPYSDRKHTQVEIYNYFNKIKCPVSPETMEILGCVFLTALLFVLFPDYSSRDSSILYLYFGISIGLALYILGDASMTQIFSLSSNVTQALAIGAFLVLGLPVFIPIFYGQESGNEFQSTFQEAESSGSQEIEHREISKETSSKAISEVEGLQGKGGTPSTKTRESKDEELGDSLGEKVEEIVGISEKNLLAQVTSFEFSLLFLVMVAGAGSGFTLGDNLAQLAVAQGYSAGALSSATTFRNIWVFAGRMGGGFGSEQLLRDYGIPRPFVTFVSQAMMVLGFLPLAFSVPGSLYFATFFTGLGEGCTYSVTITATSEILGLKNFGVLYNVLTCAIPLGSLLFSSLLAGSLYDFQFSKQLAAGNKYSYCLGGECYKITFLVLAVVVGIGALANWILARRTSKMYKELHQRQR